MSDVIERLSLSQRQAEFGRAALQRALSGGDSPAVKYMGVLKPDQRDVFQFFEKSIYDAWDSKPTSPPKVRERAAAETPDLGILSWVNGVPQMPDSVLTKFPVGATHLSAILELKGTLESLWPSTRNVRPQTNGQVVRAALTPDLSGARLLDLNREVDLPHIGLTGISVSRKPCCVEVDVSETVC